SSPSRSRRPQEAVAPPPRAALVAERCEVEVRAHAWVALQRLPLREVALVRAGFHRLARWDRAELEELEDAAQHGFWLADEIFVADHVHALQPGLVRLEGL